MNSFFCSIKGNLPYVYIAIGDGIKAEQFEGGVWFLKQIKTKRFFILNKIFLHANA